MTIIEPESVRIQPFERWAGPNPTPAIVHCDLRSSPLLALDSLANLATELEAIAAEDGSLRADWPIEHHLSDLPEVMTGLPPRLEGVPAAEVVRGIESNGCWMVMWNVERSPSYAALLDACLDQLSPQLTPGDPTVLREGFIFVSAPNTVTPVHIDPEHNVLLQITGEKTMTVGHVPDRPAWHQQIESVLNGGLRHLPFAAVDEVDVSMTPGTGVYVPPFFPHRVRNGAVLCISLSLTWRTRDFYAVEQVHVVNGRLRRLGLSPRPPGASATRDRAKVALLQGRRWAGGTIRRVVGRRAAG